MTIEVLFIKTVKAFISELSRGDETAELGYGHIKYARSNNVDLKQHMKKAID